MPRAPFEVRWEGAVGHFQNVSGLDVLARPVELLQGDGPPAGRLQIPSLPKFGDVTLSNGVFKSADGLLRWLNETRASLIKREAVTISLLDEQAAPTMVWTLAAAWPIKIALTDVGLRASEDGVVVAALVISHEGLSVTNA